MSLTILGSGSKGNAAVVASSRTRLLVDAGFSRRELLRRLSACGAEAAALDAILITHEHTDHVAGLPRLAAGLERPIYLNAGTRQALEAQLIGAGPRSARPSDPLTRGRAGGPPAPALLGRAASLPGGGPPFGISRPFAPTLPTGERRDPRVWRDGAEAALARAEIFTSGCSFQVGDIEVTPFTVPHDAADPVAFAFRAEGVRIVFVTDLGYLSENVKQQLRGADCAVIESNHDLEMLKAGGYPWSLKQRVLSRLGHLSNDTLAAYLAGEFDGAPAHLVLAHLSENNNLPELARISAERALAPRARRPQLHTAPQHQPLAPLSF